MKSNELSLPTSFSVELAEETGIHIGDGSMGVYRSGRKSHWCYTYCCHEVDDREYRNYVKKLIKKLYHMDPIQDKGKRKDHTALLRYTRKDLVLFKKKLGLPMGKKDGIMIPKWILGNKEYRIACVRGVFDTDGSFMIKKRYRKIPYYPVIKVTSKSKPLISQIKSILDEFEIKSSMCKNNRLSPRNPNFIWSIGISGFSNCRKYVNIFGFSNPKHLNKYKKIKSGGGEI